MPPDDPKSTEHPASSQRPAPPPSDAARLVHTQSVTTTCAVCARRDTQTVLRHQEWVRCPDCEIGAAVTLDWGDGTPQR
jgi:hypothetical protein